MAARILNNVAGYSAALGVGATLAASSVVIVDGGQRCVVFDRLNGVLPDVRQEGLSFVIPWLQTPHKFDIRTRPRSISSATGTKDLQTVNLTLRVLHKPNPKALPDLYVQYGANYDEVDETVLPSIGNEVLKSVVAQYNAAELLTSRDEVSMRLKKELVNRAKYFNVEVDDVAITHLSFGSEFTRAIEFKQVAEQDAERQKFLVERADQERKAAVIRAEGESEAAKLISQATSTAGSGLIELRRIEAAKEIAATMSRSRNVAYLPGGQSNMLLGLNTGGGGN